MLVGFKAEHITSDLVAGRRRQRHLARQPGARGGARSQDPALLAAGGHSRAVPLGRALDRHRRDARQDDDRVARRLAARARGSSIRTVLVGGIALNFGEEGRATGWAHGREFVIEGDEYDSAFFDKTAKFLKYLPDIALVNNIEFDHADIYADLDAVRLAFRRLANLVPRNGLLLLGSDSPDAAALRAGGSLAGRDIRAGGGRRLARLRSGGRRRDHAFQAAAAEGRTSARSSRRCSGCTTSGTRSARSPSAARSASCPARSPKDCGSSAGSSGGSKWSAA